MLKHLALGLLGLLLAIGSLVWLSARPAGEQVSQLTLNDHRLTVELAADTAAQEKGLSGRDKLTEDHGMLFVYDSPGHHGIWMKDMNFNIDVLWLEDDGRVAYMVNDMEPTSYPTSYQSDRPTRYVLELDDQAIERLGIVIGSMVQGL